MKERPVACLSPVLVVVLLVVLVAVLPVPSLGSKVIEYLDFQQATSGRHNSWRTLGLSPNKLGSPCHSNETQNSFSF